MISRDFFSVANNSGDSVAFNSESDMPCAIYNLLPTLYYLAARFRQDFESAILHAVNGGGHNQARAMLTGSLVGAQVGLSAFRRDSSKV